MRRSREKLVRDGEAQPSLSRSKYAAARSTADAETRGVKSANSPLSQERILRLTIQNVWTNPDGGGLIGRLPLSDRLVPLYRAE